MALSKIEFSRDSTWQHGARRPSSPADFDWPGRHGGGRGQRIAEPQRRARLAHPGELGEGLGELTLRFEPDQGSLWCGFAHHERPCFTQALLRDIATLQERVGRAHADWAGPRLRAVVWHSQLPGIWNLGGDLSLFLRLIRSGEREALRAYAYACVGTIHSNLTKLELPVLTLALIQGDALGGGFEAALTNDVIIAERQSKFGLPEILFGMFPGMGAYNLLCRRISGAAARSLIQSGRLHDADELAAMGLVDQVVDTGAGPAAVREYLDRQARRHKVLNTLSRVERLCQPVHYDTLIEITDLWVETAMELEEADLRRMERLASAQDRRRVRAAA
jgi:DSF synthase